MTELLRNWILGLTAAAFLTAIAMALTPKGRARAATGLTAGLVTIVALLAPLMEFDYFAYAGNVEEFELSLDIRVQEMEAAQERLRARIISERIEAYILDKAESVGLSDLYIRVETARQPDGWHYPYAARLYGTYTAEQRRTLETYLAETFGIPRERQIWSVADA